MKVNYSILEKKLNLKFKNKDLLIKSLTHKSYNKLIKLSLPQKAKIQSINN